MASGSTPNNLITLTFNIYQGELVVNSLDSQVTVLFHWYARWDLQTLQETALMTVFHVGKKNPRLAAVPHSVCKKKRASDEAMLGPQCAVEIKKKLSQVQLVLNTKDRL